MELGSFIPKCILLVIILLPACFKQPIITTQSQTAANAEIEETSAQSLSDSIVADMMMDDRRQIRSKMERAFKDYYDEDSFSALTDQMFIRKADGGLVSAQFTRTKDGQRRLR